MSSKVWIVGIIELIACRTLLPQGANSMKDVKPRTSAGEAQDAHQRRKTIGAKTKVMMKVLKGTRLREAAKKIVVRYVEVTV